MDGDGRDGKSDINYHHSKRKPGDTPYSFLVDYLIWDEDAGLTGFLNKATFKEGVPIYINQGPAKTIAEGINQLPSSIRLADMNGSASPPPPLFFFHGLLG